MVEKKEYTKPMLQKMKLEEFEENKLVKIEKRLLEVFKSALLQLIDADNKRDELSVSQLSNTSRRIGIELLRLYDLQKQKGLFDEKKLNPKIYLVQQIRDYIKKEEYDNLAPLIKKL